MALFHHFGRSRTRAARHQPGAEALPRPPCHPLGPGPAHCARQTPQNLTWRTTFVLGQVCVFLHLRADRSRAPWGDACHAMSYSCAAPGSPGHPSNRQGHTTVHTTEASFWRSSSFNTAPYNPMMASAPPMQGGYMQQPTHPQQGMQRNAAGARRENEGLVTTDVAEMSKRRRDK